MQMDSISSNDFEQKVVTKEIATSVPSVTSVKEPATVSEITPKEVAKDSQAEGKNSFGQGKEPTKNSMDAAISVLNSQIARTHCAYAYDEVTKRVSIKVYDDETDELIREVPPEKSLEALKKMWEIAGIIIDEKR